MKKTRWHIAQFFEKHWWKNYLDNKLPEDYLIWKRNYWLDFLSKIGIDLASIQDPVIDIGSGPAGMFMILEAYDITAIDPLLLQYTQLPIFETELYPKVKFKEDSFEGFKTDKKFQMIFCLNAINHFIDIEYSFEKLYAITEEGGKVVISIDAHNHSFFRKLFSLFPLDVLHPHQYYLEEYEAFLTKQGFKIDKKVLIKKAFFFDYWVFIAEKR
jgi:2-polyprenyl-6-hydroxyphenyl methylase/3-demethylubiquinone-9 3-methyltransferase